LLETPQEQHITTHDGQRSVCPPRHQFGEASVHRSKLRRQAIETARELLGDLETEQPDLSGVPSAPLPALDPGWALPALVSAWSLTMGQDDAPWRPAIKAAVIALKNSTTAGTSRSRRVLGDVVRAHGRGVSDELRSYGANWVSSDDNDASPSGTLKAVGRSIQTAQDASGLIRMGLTNAVAHLRPFAHGEGDPSSFASTAPHLAQIATGARTVWVGLYLRFAALYSILTHNTELGVEERPHTALAVLPRDFRTSMRVLLDGEDAYAGITDDDVTTLLAGESSWSYEDEAMLSAFPLISVGDDSWVTSIALLLDSIAPFLLLAIKDTNQWEAAMAAPFERSVISFLNDLGFVAGEVSKSGFWDAHLPQSRHQTGTGPTQPFVEQVRKELQRRNTGRPTNGSLAGQVDVLATDGRDWFVFECKSIMATASPRNVTERVSLLDSEEWRSKLRAKVVWIESQLRLRVALSAVVIEGIEYVAESEFDANPPVVTFDVLREALAAGVEQQGIAP
jgi:hypothetical protein